MTNEQLVSKVWNYAHVLRDQGISYGDYIEQITYLLFLKMDQERVDLLGEPSSVPSEWNWTNLSGKSGDELELQYRHTLEELAKQSGLIGRIFRKSQNKLSDPAKLTRVVSLIDKEGAGLNQIGGFVLRPIFSPSQEVGIYVAAGKDDSAEKPALTEAPC